VTATLTEQDRVRDYVSTLNQTLGQQIAFDVNVLNVRRSTKDGFGVDIEQLAFGSGSNSVSWQGGRGVDGAIGSVNVGIIEGDLNLDVVIQALSSLNDVSIETRAGATTTNFQMIPIEVVERVNYVSSVSREVDDNGVITTSLETSTETTGFQLQLLPRVLNAREVLLRYSLDLSDLVALDEFTSGDSTVQLPRVTESNFEQQVILKNGQTLVLSGFERQRTELKREGVGSPRFIGLGGSADGELSRATSIVFITPRLLSRGNTNN
jgi:type IVB pilus formation R64 PilN family outer membrane protein